MEFAIIILLAVILVAIAFAGMALQVLLKKGGKFPNTHVGGNPYLQRQGISCAKTQDRIEQAEVARNVNFKNIRFIGVDKK
ncbi:MAG: hypothetical protein ACOC0R_01825 [Mariniphaga sp.]